MAGVDRIVMEVDFKAPVGCRWDIITRLARYGNLSPDEPRYMLWGRC